MASTSRPSCRALPTNKASAKSGAGLYAFARWRRRARSAPLPCPFRCPFLAPSGAPSGAPEHARAPFPRAFPACLPRTRLPRPESRYLTPPGFRR